MDLHSPEPFWLIRNGLIRDHASLTRDTSCDVLVIGAGITGALVAERLSREGAEVVVVDRRRIGAGSTSASTALLIYDIDRPLHELIGVVGEPHALRAYRMGIEAIEDLASLCADWPDVGFVRRSSMLVAKPDEAEAVAKEYNARAAHGFDVSYLDEGELRECFGIRRPNAMQAAVAAELDPYRLAHRLLERAAMRGARLYDHTNVMGKKQARDQTDVFLANGARIRARHVVYATGYEASQVIGRDYVKLHSTFALATEPFAQLGPWTGDPILWETGDPYLYLRTSPSGRVIIGGEDEPFQNAVARDKLLPVKVETILRKAQTMMPELDLRPEFKWAGTFGHTHDGLPYIGAHPDHPGCLFALGYGGNGITFSTMAAWILTESCKGNQHPDADIYAFERPTAGK